MRYLYTYALVVIAFRVTWGAIYNHIMIYYYIYIYMYVQCIFGIVGFIHQDSLNDFHD